MDKVKTLHWFFKTVFMLDSRWEQLADILVNYSTSTGPGGHVLITMIETIT
jgi:hypothetical protein